MMDKKRKNDVVPYYATLPMLQPKTKEPESKTTIPDNAAVKETRDWSKELKL